LKSLLFDLNFLGQFDIFFFIEIHATHIIFCLIIEMSNHDLYLIPPYFVQTYKYDMVRLCQMFEVRMVGFLHWWNY